jgi:glucose uptake protein GlcU
MKKIDFRYWIGLAAVTLALAFAAWLVFSFAFPGSYPRIFPVFLGMVVLITGAGQVLLTKSLAKNPKKFNSWYMIYKALKMLVIATFLVVYVVVRKENGIPFLASVFVIYLVFMVFESVSLTRVAKRQS